MKTVYHINSGGHQTNKTNQRAIKKHDERKDILTACISAGNLHGIHLKDDIHDLSDLLCRKLWELDAHHQDWVWHSALSLVHKGSLYVCAIESLVQSTTDS